MGCFFVARYAGEYAGEYEIRPYDVISASTAYGRTRGSPSLMIIAFDVGEYKIRLYALAASRAATCSVGSCKVVAAMLG